MFYYQPQVRGADRFRSPARVHFVNDSNLGNSVELSKTCVMLTALLRHPSNHFPSQLSDVFYSRHLHLFHSTLHMLTSKSPSLAQCPALLGRWYHRPDTWCLICSLPPPPSTPRGPHILLPQTMSCPRPGRRACSKSPPLNLVQAAVLSPYSHFPPHPCHPLNSRSIANFGRTSIGTY